MKGITPIIAIIVLLLITVAVAGSAWTYLQQYVGGLTSSQMEVVDYFCVGGNQAKILVRNTGTAGINTADISVIDTETGNVLNDEVKWTKDAGERNLELELKLDEGNGNYANDTSGNGMHGTLAGNPTWRSGSDCVRGSCLDFDGNGDYINLPSINPTGAITVSAWVKSSTSSGYPGVWQIVSKYNAYILGTSGTGSRNMCFITCNVGQCWTYGTCHSVADPEEWHHFAGTYNATSGLKELYFDGVLVDSDSYSPSTIRPDTGPLQVAKRECCSQVFSGHVDDVRIYSRILDQAEVQAIMSNSVYISPNENVAITHPCIGKCKYRVMLGSRSTQTSVNC